MKNAIVRIDMIKKKKFYHDTRLLKLCLPLEQNVASHIKLLRSKACLDHSNRRHSESMHVLEWTGL